MLEEKILELKREITGFAGIVEKMVDKSIKGLVNKDKDILDEVIRIDEPKVNNLEIEIDELCTTLIAQYAPKGKDLRIILMAMKMNNDLERIGDHAVNITQSSLSLIESPFVKPLNDIPKMSEAAVNMFKDSINAFVNEDPALAKGVCERDNTVDDLRTKIMKELTLYMGKDPSTIERSLNLIRITGNLERIADLSTNICEDVIYLAEGRVIKHNKV
ncbi:MAG: phosphate transport system regulatory protein PhoU [Elusimicrobia bacterium RIFOXYB2_FULL_48_7]|nr:MAG: phosphate transport system regulatory protein PhoU [Elusimicrobia bacterium RIFOXYB2_FULL_48_7]